VLGESIIGALDTIEQMADNPEALTREHWASIHARICALRDKVEAIVLK